MSFKRIYGSCCFRDNQQTTCITRQIYAVVSAGQAQYSRNTSSERLKGLFNIRCGKLKRLWLHAAGDQSERPIRGMKRWSQQKGTLRLYSLPNLDYQV